MMDKELREGARNAICVCMNVKEQDRVFILSDDEVLVVGQALQAEALSTGATVELKRLEEYAPRPITIVPDKLVADILAFKPTVSLFAASAQEGELAMRMGMGISLRELEVRHGHMVGITARAMREGMRADYNEVYALTHKVYDIVRKAKKIHVTSEKGSDLTARFDPQLEWIPCHGLYHEQGSWGNLPEGEVFTSPATLDGIIVADVLGDYFDTKYGILSQPVIFEVEDGLVENVQCETKEIEDEVWDYLNSSENGRRTGEFAIGTNTALTALMGSMLQDEKMPGVHVAFGNPYPKRTGADWSSKVHVDVIPSRSTIEVDGEVIMVDGQFQL